MKPIQSILAVDDKLENLYALETVLKELDVELVKKTSGNDALAATLDKDFALAILDVQMPDMDGYELAELMRSDEKTGQIPIIFLSAVYSDEFHVSVGYEKGAVDFISKPYDPEILLNKVKVFLELDRHKRKLKNLVEELEQTNTKLHSEIEVRKQAQEELHRSHEELEMRVEERTVDLRKANEQLLQEIEVRKRAEKELAEANKGMLALTVELQEKNEALNMTSEQLWQAGKLATMGELAASIAHEMNNPLQTVSLRVESLMLAMSEQEQPMKNLQLIEQEVERMADLVSNLLEFSHRGTQRISSLNIGEEIDKSLELIYYKFNKRQIAVERDYEEGIPLVNADSQQLRQLFLNLFSNASDAMPDGGTLKIGVNLAREGGPEEQGKSVRIIIEDTGEGISLEHMSKLMEPFYTTKPEGKGTGLGLSICRRIVEGHKGRLDIESEPGKGTKISIVLPIANDSNNSHLREG